MIEKMKKVIVLSPASRKAEMLDGIRDLGVMHVSEKAAPDASVAERISQLNRVKGVLAEYGKVEQKEPVTGAGFEAMDRKLLAALDERASIADETSRLRVLREAVLPWGDFDPSDIRMLETEGFPMSFYAFSSKELPEVLSDVSYIRLKGFDKKNAVAVIGKDLGPEYASQRFVLPEKGIGQIDRELEAREQRLVEIDAMLQAHACYVSSYNREITRLTDELAYIGVSDAAMQEEGFCLLTGFIPADDMEAFRKKAKDSCWAYAVDDPSDEDPVPTKVKYNKVTKMMKPMFDMLGITPGYREYDTSMWFMLFLALFFAMIIGDAAYGMIFLAAGIAMNVKARKVTNLNLLVYVMSGATVVWGALTGTWFGAEAAMKVPFLRALVIPQISNYPEYFGLDSTSAQNMVMKFCFMVGTIQLSLACIMNIIRKWQQKSLAFVSDFAWLAIIISIYFMALMLVVGAPVNIKLIFGVIAVGFVLVVLFGSQAPGQSFSKGLKAGAGGAFTTFLNTISTFGNVMSYIRLFAVGMASLAIAQSFNNMASPMLRGFALPAGILILVIGHVLNIIMGMLSVIVHGVRLNLLEFSGQLGMEWAGIPYEPFKKNV